MHFYLEKRNIFKNRSKMANRKKINLIDHYIWWLSQEFKSRETYKFIENNEILFFIWHKKIIVNKKKYLVGGWFPANDNANISDILYLLKWQLNIKKNKNIKWLAIINKNNRVVLKLNQILGFSKKFKFNYDLMNAKKYFQASEKKFFYLIL